MDVRDALLAEIEPRTLYRILALRSEIFVLEQDCAYLDPDGRDLEPDARQLWITDADGEVVATLRLLVDPDDTIPHRPGATARAARGRGLAGQLMDRALEIVGTRESVLGAQAHLAHWYTRFGYVRDGEDYDEDGIPHTPMRRHLAS